MSERFFEFTIRCPKCGAITNKADGFETDDWVEVFAFSGYSKRSARCYHEYSCPYCNESTDIDSLYSGKFITPKSIDDVKKYLAEMLPYVYEHKGIYDHGWDPDVETAVQRYALLYPEDKELQSLKKLYFYAYHDSRKLTKFEPIRGTRIITHDMILCPELLKKCYLPDGVVEIGDYAFFECTKLGDIFLPKTVNRIGISAFENCTGLTSIHTSDDLEIIGEKAFSGCVSLTNFFFPERIKEIGKESFSHCKRLGKVYIPINCQVIGQDAFYNCRNLVIYGKQGTVAEQYAKNNNIKFIAD